MQLASCSTSCICPVRWPRLQCALAHCFKHVVFPQVNAWTTSRVQRSILALFCRCEAALPNFWVGSLSHDSVNAALASGISANEIIAYLQAHAHPQVQKRKPVVPEVR